MKIKAVCDATGLTDRTVRFYIEEGLVTPKYQQNYLGRKTFDFSDEDIKTLESIAVFRKYGFSVAEIKEIYEQPENIISMAQQAKDRLEAGIAEDTQKIEILSLINTGRTYTPREFAIFLSLPIEESKPEEKEEQESTWKKALRDKTDFFFESGLFYLSAAIAVIYLCRKQYLFPSAPWWSYLPFLAATICVVVRIRWNVDSDFKKRALLFFIFLLCAVGVRYVFMPNIRSYTEDTDDYRIVDSFHEAFDNPAFHELFPLRPLGTLEDYYYQSGNYYHRDEVYAEVTVNSGVFDGEVARVKEWFEIHATTPDEDYNIYKFLTIKNGSYECLVLHGVFYGFPEGPKEGTPFSLEEAGTYYKCLIFAYNEKTKVIRYIIYNRKYSEDTPYYLTVDW